MALRRQVGGTQKWHPKIAYVRHCPTVDPLHANEPLTDEVNMWSLSITAVAICSVTALYLWALYCWRGVREEENVERDARTERFGPRGVDGSGFEFEYLMTADYPRR